MGVISCYTEDSVTRNSSKKHMCVIHCLYWKPDRKESFMNKYMDKPKSTQAVAPQQPKATQVSAPPPPKAAQVPAPRPIDIPRPRPVATATLTHEDIARRAYQIYVEKGCPQDQSEQIWKQAEQDIQGRGLATFLPK
jgi:hypothetical protein